MKYVFPHEVGPLTVAVKGCLKTNFSISEGSGGGGIGDSDGGGGGIGGGDDVV